MERLAPNCIPIMKNDLKIRIYVKRYVITIKLKFTYISRLF